MERVQAAGKDTPIGSRACLATDLEVVPVRRWVPDSWTRIALTPDLMRPRPVIHCGSRFRRTVAEVSRGSEASDHDRDERTQERLA